MVCLIFRCWSICGYEVHFYKSQTFVCMPSLVMCLSPGTLTDVFSRIAFFFGVGGRLLQLVALLFCISHFYVRTSFPYLLF